MKQSDIKPCCVCGEGVGHCGPAFYTVRLTQQILLERNITRHAGLEQMLGSATLASVMGVDADISQEMCATADLWICQECAMKTPILMLLEYVEASEEDEK